MKRDYVGETHIDPERVVLNARREGVEETDQWLSIKTSLMETICRPLADDAYAASRRGQLAVEKVVDDVDKLVDRSRTIAENSRSSYDLVVDLMGAVRRLRRRTSTALSYRPRS